MPHQICCSACPNVLTVKAFVHMSSPEIRHAKTLLYAGNRSDKASFQQAQARLGFEVLPAAQAYRCQGKMHAQFNI